MKVVFLGVGAAFDKDLPNNSHLIESETKLLLDCGFAAVQQLWKHDDDPEFLDAVYISHAHADHYFGLPALIARAGYEGRKKDITIICQKSDRQKIIDVLDLGFGITSKDYQFEIKFLEIDDGDSISFKEFKLSFALMEHPVRNLAIRIDDGTNVLGYSGDGTPTPKAWKLYEGSDLVIHEAFRYDEKLGGHGCVVDLIENAKTRRIKCLALTHMDWRYGKQERNKIRKELNAEKGIKVVIPEPMDTWSFNSQRKN